MPKPLTILFAGTSAFAVPSLQALAQNPAFRVIGVITQPDRPTGRKQTLTAPPVKDVAEKLKHPVFQPEKLNTEFATISAGMERPDFLVVVSYGQIVSQAILDFPTIAPINVHASLLPRWRGASPLQHAILGGDTETGVTIQKMVKQLDAGPILAQQSTPIDARETAMTLHDRLSMLGAELLVATLKKPLNPHDQDESKVTLCGKLTRQDGVVDSALLTAEEIDRKLRALTPWPAITMKVDGADLKILETSLQPDDRAHAVTCKDNTQLYLISVQPAGKKAMTGVAWGRGRK